MADTLSLLVDSGRISLMSLHPAAQDSPLGVSPNVQAALISAIVAILIFLIGNHHKRYLDACTKIEELQGTEPFIYHSFESLLRASRLLTQAFEDHIKPLRDNHLPEVIASGQGPDLDFENIKAIPRKLFYEVLYSNKIADESKKKEAFDTLFISLGYILKIQNKFPMNVNEFVTELKRVHPLLDEASQKLSAHHEFAMSNHSSDDKRLLDSIHKIRTQLGENYDPYEIAASIELVRDEARKGSGHLFDKYSALCEEYCFYFEEFKRAVASEIEMFESYSKRLTQANNSIDQTLIFFRSLPNKSVSWWRLSKG